MLERYEKILFIVANETTKASYGKMEIAAVGEMLVQPKTFHVVKKAYYFSDGDSQTFKGKMDEIPHESFELQKKECSDHTQKWMGTLLRIQGEKVN